MIRQFHEDITIPIIKSCLTGERVARRAFFIEFNTWLASKRRRVPELMIMDCFLSFCSRQDLKNLIDDTHSRFFTLILNVLRKVSPVYGGDYKMNYDYDFWHEEVFKILKGLIFAPLRDEILRAIKGNNSYDIAFFISSSLIDKLTHKDVSYLVHNPDINLIGKTLTLLKDMKNWKPAAYSDMDYVNFFTEKFCKRFSKDLAVKITDLFAFDNIDDFKFILDFNLLFGLKNKAYHYLANNSKLIDVLKNEPQFNELDSTQFNKAMELKVKFREFF